MLCCGERVTVSTTWFIIIVIDRRTTGLCEGQVGGWVGSGDYRCMRFCIGLAYWHFLFWLVIVFNIHVYCTHWEGKGEVIEHMDMDMVLCGMAGRRRRFHGCHISFWVSGHSEALYVIVISKLPPSCWSKLVSLLSFIVNFEVYWCVCCV